MNDRRWKRLFVFSLVTLSFLLYAVHFFLFRDPHHIFIFLVSDVAFVPIEVLLVTLVIHQLMIRHEKKEVEHKLNMVVGVFFHELGGILIDRMKGFLTDTEGLRTLLDGIEHWDDADYQRGIQKVLAYKPKFSCAQDLRGLRDFLRGKRIFILRLLENPNLLEHDRFSSLLWAVTHVADELEIQPDIDNLSKGVAAHISRDMGRAFRLLVGEWLSYLRHLRRDYPYMYKGALKQGPLAQP
jgi:hypothetical protein